jgi:hypothetical protein
MADTLIRNLTSGGAAQDADVLAICRDPSGTPLDRKLTAAALAALARRRALLGLDWFEAEGFLPANTVFDTETWPAADFSNLNGGTLSRSRNRAKFAASSSPANFGWDLGAARNEALLILPRTHPAATNFWLFFSATLPSGSEIPAALTGVNELNSLRCGVGRFSGSGHDSYDVSEDPYDDAGMGLALHWANGGDLSVFTRSEGVWSLSVSKSGITASTTVRYAGIRPEQSGTTSWFYAPLWLGWD